MRRQWLLNLAAGASLLLCVTWVLLWVRSYFAEDTLSFRPGQSLFAVHVFQSRGSIATTHTTAVDYQLHVHRFKLESSPANIDLYKYWRDLAPLVYAGGFAVIRSPSPRHAGGILVPHWFLVLMTAGLPAIVVRSAWNRRRAERAGMQLCPACGYDMRATPDRCPECGRTALAGATPT